MFDVIWTDPNRELVGEHRAKKEKRWDHKSREKKRSSLSTRRSSLPSTDSPFSFLRSRGLKRINASGANSKSRSTPSSSLASSSLASSSVSFIRPLISTGFDARDRPRSGVAATCSSDDPASAGKLSAYMATSSEDDPPQGLSRHGENLFSLARSRDSLIVETLDPIFPEYTDSDGGMSQSIGEVSALEQGRRQQNSVNEAVRGNPVKGRFSPSENLISRQTSRTDGRDSHQNVTWPRSSRKPILPTNNLGTSALVLAPGPLAPGRAHRHPQLNNPGAWRSPEQWTVAFESRNSTIDALEDMLSKCNTSSKSMASAFDVGFWKVEIQRKSSMSLDDVVSSLKLICGPKPIQGSGTTDEAERIRWMLWALTDLDPIPTKHKTVLAVQNLGWNDSDRVLILYESQDIASYLTAFYSTSQIYHLSPTPLPPTFSSNIHPLTVPSVHPSDFPPSDTQYDTVVSLSLPSLSPALDIPPILTKINGCLCPGGTLRLLVIDPLPCSGTLGRHMRSWLRDHLLTNLERTFRCASPTKLFPDWLAEASLRGNGSTITKTRFFANPASVKLHASSDVAVDDLLDPSFKTAHEGRVAKAEVRSLAGRFLWKHIWGPFVTGNNWWWDEPVCVAECLELGTIWEYQIIDGVKDCSADDSRT